jgi:hypothetical protein
MAFCCPSQGSGHQQWHQQSDRAWQVATDCTFKMVQEQGSILPADKVWRELVAFVSIQPPILPIPVS